MERVAIWGAGKYGEILFSILQSEYKIECFFDQNEEKQRNEFCEKKVYSPDQIEIILETIEGIVVGVLDKDEQRKILLELSKYKGLTVIYGDDWQHLKKWETDGRIKIPYLECNVIDGCNLNCKGCSHFSSLYNKTEVYNLDRFRSDIEILSNHVSVDCFRLLGGEPLLLNNIEDYLACIRSFFANTDIHLVTNGILLMSEGERFWDSLKKNRIHLDITFYKPISKNILEIRRKCQSYEIEYTISSMVFKFKKQIIEKGNSEMNIAYFNCDQRFCLFLRNGNLYHCPNEALIERFIDVYGMNISNTNEGVDYREEKDWYKVFARLYKPFKLCKYCEENGGVEFDWEIGMIPSKGDWCF